MKYVTDRKEIARKINIENIPVLTMDLKKPMDGYPNCYEGSKVKVQGIRAKMKMFGDELGNDNHRKPWTYKKIVLTSYGVCIKSGFDLLDVDNMVEWSNAREVKEGDKVLVYFRGEDFGILREMKIGKVNKFCSTVAELEDVE